MTWFSLSIPRAFRPDTPTGTRSCLAVEGNSAVDTLAAVAAACSSFAFSFTDDDRLRAVAVEARSDG
jgi:hypothetical protein